LFSDYFATSISFLLVENWQTDELSNQLFLDSQKILELGLIGFAAVHVHLIMIENRDFLLLFWLLFLIHMPHRTPFCYVLC